MLCLGFDEERNLEGRLEDYYGSNLELFISVEKLSLFYSCFARSFDS